MFTPSEWWDRFLVPIDDPGSRLFHLNILFSVALVGAWIFFYRGERRSMWSGFRKLVFNKRYWWNHSTRLDYQIYLFNGLLKIFLLIPFLDFSFKISSHVSRMLIEVHGDTLGWTAGTGEVFGFTALAFVWDDFLRFGQHYLMHKIPLLWRIHSVHHSATVLTPITLFRNHPLESAIATLRNSLSLGVMTGLFIFCFGARFSIVTLLGVNVFGFLFNLFGANLRHSHIPFSFGPLIEKYLISPRLHQIHHSRDPAHFGKNLGVSLALWDRVFGTLVLSRGTEPLRFGNARAGRETFFSAVTLGAKQRDQRL